MNEHDQSDQDRKPGWYPDPEDGPKQRWWDGKVWRTQPRSAKLEERRRWAAELAKNATADSDDPGVGAVDLDSAG